MFTPYLSAQKLALTPTLMIALTLAVFATPAIAQDYVVRVNGIVCEFCAFGVTKKVSKLKFIDRTKYNKGVEVDVKEQLVTIAVKTAASLDRKALYDAIESGGYNPVELWELAEDGSRTLVQPSSE